MKFIFTDKAKEYLEKKGEKVLTVDLFVGGACVEISEPIAKLGPPTNIQHKFDVYESEGYTIHLFKGADIKDDTLTITLSKFFGIEALEVKGVKML
ncbi:MAG: hypothetical protein JXQ26_10665 [Tissierellales bacterium]|nr:hypothetical protein [Tissierellales bacterium]MBN2828447.1 hypothetical protein [Tissierellales bacterium]